MAKAQWQVKRIRDEKEYKTGGNSDFISLDEGEKFLGYFLGDADEKIDDPAFFPYQVHWINNGSVPCAGEDCVYCEEGDRPRAKALTLWLVLEDEKGNKLGKNGEGELRIWDMPVSAIKQFREFRAEDEKIKGRLFRVRRPDEKTYIVMPKSETLKATELKASLKEGPNFEEMLTSKLRKAMEGVAVARAMQDDDDDDDDDDEDEKPKSKKGDKSKGKGKAKAEPEDDDDDDDDDDDAPDPDDGMPEEATNLEVTITKVNKENSIMVKFGDNDPEKVWGTEEVDVTDLGKGQIVAISYVTDDDDDKVLTDAPEEAPEKDDGEDDALPESIEDVEFEITEINESNQTMEVKNDDLEFTLYFLDKGPASKVDFDDYEAGDKIVFSAEKDSVGDMVATSIPEKAGKPKGKAKGGKSAGKGKGKGKKK